MKQNKLQKYFPMIRSRQEVLEEIHNSPELLRTYSEWKEMQQEEFLAFVTGARGVKILYDSFFREVLNPETVPERLNELLSILLGRKVHILTVLTTDNSRLGDETSLVIMDIIVKLEDGTIIDVEVQKVGYRFPGQRSACYSADMLLRQYKAAREQSAGSGRRFSYYDIHDVYTIVFFESSPEHFDRFPDIYLHRFEQKSDTGLEISLLQKYLFISLDIFRKNLQNKGITGKLDAWLAFLSCDEPDIIAELIRQYPEFRPMYEHIYNVCRNMEKVMGMFSEELRILDRNTVQLMIDDMKDDIEKQEKILQEQKRKMQEQQSRIEAQKDTIENQKDTIEDQKDTIEEQKDTIEEQKDTIENQKDTIENQKDTIEEQKAVIARLQRELEEMKVQV